MNRRGGLVARARGSGGGLRGGDASVDGGKTAVVVRVGVSAGSGFDDPCAPLESSSWRSRFRFEARRGTAGVVVLSSFSSKPFCWSVFDRALPAGTTAVVSSAGAESTGRTTSAATGWFDRGGGPRRAEASSPTNGSRVSLVGSFTDASP